MRKLRGALFTVLLIGSSWQVHAQQLEIKSMPVTGLNSPTSPLKCDKGLIYTPLPRFDANTYTSVISKDGKTTFAEASWPTSTEDINALLPNVSTEIAVVSANASGSLAAIFTGKASKKVISIDFIKYRSEPLVEKVAGVETIYAYARVGVGMRITIDLAEVDTDFSGTLAALGLSAKAGATKGTISAELMGINAPDVTLSMPFTSDLSEASIQRVIEAMAVVKSRLHDSKTTLKPQLIARMSCKT